MKRRLMTKVALSICAACALASPVQADECLDLAAAAMSDINAHFTEAADELDAKTETFGFAVSMAFEQIGRDEERVLNWFLRKPHKNYVTYLLSMQTRTGDILFDAAHALHCMVEAAYD